MGLMTVEEFSNMLLKYGVNSTDENIFEVMSKLDACHQEQKFELQYGMLFGLVAAVRRCMPDPASPEGWQAEMMAHLRAYVLSRMGEQQEAVPSVLHFVWIGSAIPQVVMDYVKLWAKINPGYAINIWYDSNLLCLKKLSDFLKQKAEESYNRVEQEEEWANEVFQLRQQFTEFVLSNTSNLTYMTDTINRFLKRPDASFVPFEDDLVWVGAYPCTNIHVRDLNGERMLAPLYREYMMEAIQTQNFAALSDMARLLVLKKYGGVYIDVDMMPEINTDLKEHFAGASDNLERVLIQAIMEGTGEIPGYRTDELNECDRAGEIRNTVAGEGLDKLMVPLGVMCCQPMAFQVYHNGQGVINQMVLAHENSFLIARMIQQIKDNYATMYRFFPRSLLAGKTLEEVTEELYKITEGESDPRIQSFLGLCTQYYKTGLRKGAQTTIYLTGPSVYRSLLNDTITLQCCDCIDAFCEFCLEGEENVCFKVPRCKLSTQTEEELRSSWVVR